MTSGYARRGRGGRSLRTAYAAVVPLSASPTPTPCGLVPLGVAGRLRLRTASSIAARPSEAAHQSKDRAWAKLPPSAQPVVGGQRTEFAASLHDAAPRLTVPGRAELQNASPGNLTWQQACNTIGVPFTELPGTTADA